MIKTKNIVLLSLALWGLMSGCSKESYDDAEARVTFSVPVSVALENQVTFEADATRAAAGDPGVNDELAAPTHLYVWALVNLGTAKDGSQNALLFRHFTLSDADWTYTLGENAAAEASENQQTRYVKTLDVTFSADRTLAADGGRVYAIASTRELTTGVDGTDNLTSTELPAALTEMMTMTNYEGGQYSKAIATGELADKKSALEDMQLTLAAWESNDLRDLYSSPLNCSTETKANGTITWDNTTVTVVPLKLYHCAAKVDFTWEVSSALQATTKVATIEVTNLPTACKAFDPTHNTAAAGTCKVLGNADAANLQTPGNQWIGRAYAYVLQQPGATLNATTTFEGGRTAAQTAFTPTSPDETYTGWYRMNATIN